jgi:hypothetical protein
MPYGFTRRIPPAKVFRSGYQFQVLRINAGSISAKVVNLEVVLYVRDERCISEAMTAHLDAANLDGGIAVPAGPAGQIPAGCRLLYGSEESGYERLDLLLHHRHPAMMPSLWECLRRLPREVPEESVT